MTATHCIMGYTDDTLLLANSLEEAQSAVEITVHMLTDLGFTIHPEKSLFTPQQEIEFLGFVINSENIANS